MSTISYNTGVCLACRFGGECIYGARARQSILRCGQFDLAVPSRDSGRLAGLCSNCEFRDTCIYPKPEGGVWRCEEYR